MAEYLRQQKKTRRRIQKAFLCLAEEKNLQAITMQDIAAEAGITRSTLYRYYQSPKAIMDDICQEYRQASLAIIPDLDQVFLRDEQHARHQEKAAVLVSLLQFHDRWRQVYLMMWKDKAPNGAAQWMEEAVCDIYRRNLRRSGRSLGEDEEKILHFFSIGFHQTISRWLKEKDLATEEMAEFLLGAVETFSL